MQYLILIIATMTAVIYVKEKSADNTGKKQPELVTEGWKKFAVEVKGLFTKKNDASVVEPVETVSEPVKVDTSGVAPEEIFIK